MHTNNINGKQYIGQTCLKPEYRWNNGEGFKTQYFYKAIQEFGWENFSHTILEDNLSNIEADARERYWIKYYNTLIPNGYNESLGGGGVSIITRKKMSESAKQHWSKASEERREQQRQIMTQINKTVDRTGKNNPMYGVRREGKDSPNKRKVKCVETGKTFDTVTEASKWCNNGKTSLRSHIAEQIQGKRQSAGKHPITKEKLHWKYVDGEEE